MPCGLATSRTADFRIARRFDLDHSSLSAFVEVSNFLGRRKSLLHGFRDRR